MNTPKQPLLRTLAAIVTPLYMDLMLAKYPEFHRVASRDAARIDALAAVLPEAIESLEFPSTPSKKSLRSYLSIDRIDEKIDGFDELYLEIQNFFDMRKLKAASKIDWFVKENQRIRGELADRAKQHVTDVETLSGVINAMKARVADEHGKLQHRNDYLSSLLHPNQEGLVEKLRQELRDAHKENLHLSHRHMTDHDRQVKEIAQLRVDLAAVQKSSSSASDDHVKAINKLHSDIEAMRNSAKMASDYHAKALNDSVGLKDLIKRQSNKLETYEREAGILSTALQNKTAALREQNEEITKLKMHDNSRVDAGNSLNQKYQIALSSNKNLQDLIAHQRKTIDNLKAKNEELAGLPPKSHWDDLTYNKVVGALNLIGSGPLHLPEFIFIPNLTKTSPFMQNSQANTRQDIINKVRSEKIAASEAILNNGIKHPMDPKPFGPESTTGSFGFPGSALSKAATSDAILNKGIKHIPGFSGFERSDVVAFGSQPGTSISAPPIADERPICDAITEILKEFKVETSTNDPLDVTRELCEKIDTLQLATASATQILQDKITELANAKQDINHKKAEIAKRGERISDLEQRIKEVNASEDSPAIGRIVDVYNAHPHLPDGVIGQIAHHFLSAEQLAQGTREAKRSAAEQRGFDALAGRASVPERVYGAVPRTEVAMLVSRESLPPEKKSKWDVFAGGLIASSAIAGLIYYAAKFLGLLA